jgi:crotonobetainyl-CoA:carnitine CoA-transferase CaiB-like acyl-CoA transferase
MSSPLSGMRIVDLGMYVAGPYASVPLGELGADVIKIEPLTGDPNRGVWRAYSCCNRGKRSILLDLKHEEGLQIAQKLCVTADVVHHNFRPGVAQRLGLGYEKLREENPALIFLEASAYGDEGPMSKMPGFDMMMQALCGHEAHCAGAGNAPLWLRWAPVDFTGGYLGTIGILASIYRKLKTGEGGVVKANLLDAGLFMLSELVQNPSGEFEGLAPMNAAQTGQHPTQSIYQTGDGWISVVARSPEQAGALALALDLPDLATLPVKEWGQDSQQRIASSLGSMSCNEAVELLRSHGVWTEPCRDNVEQAVFNDDAWASAGIVREYPHKHNGNIKQLGNMLRFSATESSTDTSGRVAQAGEDTREILVEIGYSEVEIDDFYQRKIVA